jgi:hypothetical protein
MIDLPRIAQKVANQIPRFDGNFDPEKLAKIEQFIPKVYEVLEEVVGRSISWPTMIDSMTPEEIDYSESRGGGHGICYKDEGIVKMNIDMTPVNLLYNFIHENLHYAAPDMVEEEVDKLTEIIYNQVVGDEEIQ